MLLLSPIHPQYSSFLAVHECNGSTIFTPKLSKKVIAPPPFILYYTHTQMHTYKDGSKVGNKTSHMHDFSKSFVFFFFFFFFEKQYQSICSIIVSSEFFSFILENWGLSIICFSSPLTDSSLLCWSF